MSSTQVSPPTTITKSSSHSSLASHDAMPIINITTPPNTILSTSATPTSTKALGSGSMCVVCNDIAPSNTVFRRHYGVICCEACKCFFRRTVQMGRDYKCRFSNTCPVGRNTVNIKQVCQACRFNRCTEAGMKIESVKKFPRKSKEHQSENSSSIAKEKQFRTNKKRQPITTNGTDILATNSAPIKQDISTEPDYESDLELFKFNVSSPELSVYNSSGLDTNLPKLFSGESLENIHEKSSIPTPESSSSESNDKRSPQIAGNMGSIQTHHVYEKSTNSKPSPLKIIKQPSPLINVQVPPPTFNNDDTLKVEHLDGGRQPQQQQCVSSDSSAMKRPNVNFNEMLLKKQRLEEALSTITARQIQVQANLQRLTVANNNNSHLSMGVVQPHPPLNYSDLSLPLPVKQEHTPYATPHGTPHGTPVPSPLPSPHVPYPPPICYHSSLPPTPHPCATPHNLSQPATPLNRSMPTSPVGSSYNYFYPPPPPTAVNNHPALQQHQPLSFPSVHHHQQQQVGYGSGCIPPMVQHSSWSPPVPHSIVNDNHNLSFKGSMSLPGSTVTSPVSLKTSFLSPSFTHDDPKLTLQIQMDNEIASYTASTCPSPLLKPSKTLACDAPEAHVEEVLESLKQRIRYMFKWAKSEVRDFDDLSPLDQKALLRRTIPELIMLGFARRSIPYEGMLLLGSTGKVIRPTNSNSGVAAVALITLTKLVVPLKAINMDDKEYSVMKEIVLFNPESNCLCNREAVREYRKQKHIQLMEYSGRYDPSRFGELLCLLTPLYEVSLEVTEQLRLEQFVHEGEARIDALLLMSMINQGGGAIEPMDDGD